MYPEDWAGLSFDALAAIKEAVGDLPLVLHGGTGIPVDQIQKAISLGVSKINVNTDLQLVFAAATSKANTARTTYHSPARASKLK